MRNKNRKSVRNFLFVLLSVGFVLLAVSFVPLKLNSQQIWFEKKPTTPATAKSAEVTNAKNIFVNLAKEVNPTVVNVFTSHTIKFRGYSGYPDDMFKMFEQFMGPGFRHRQQEMEPMERKTMALGSGFIINKEGYIVTNNHVIDDADKVKVKLFDGKEYEAKVIGADPEMDVALIKINAKKDLPFAYLGDSSKTEVGEWVLAIGNPVGQSNSVTAGIVSAKGRLVPDVNVYSDFIQTDAAINPGNSGGPLVNINGEVIGINTAINRQQGFVPIEGIGFAIPINNVKKDLMQLAKGEKISHKHGWLGVSLSDLTDSIADNLKLKDVDNGAVITEVVPNTPAQKAGLKPYDVVVKFDNDPITGAADLSMAVKKADVAKEHEFEIIRNGAHQKIKIKLEGKKAEELAKQGAGQPEKGKRADEVGVSVAADPANDGVKIVQIDPDSRAAQAGVQEGDVVLEVNQTKVKTPDDFYKAFKPKGGNMLRIKRGDGTVIIAFN